MEGRDLSAGDVEPSTIEYTVVNLHAHRSLRLGDVVMVIKDPTCRNWLFRGADTTLHRMADEHDQYVHLRAKEDRADGRQ